MRAVLVAKRGSSRHSGWPSTSAMRSQFAWLAPPMLIQPSLARNAWYGAVRICAEPVAPGRFAGREVDRRVPVGLLQRGFHQRRIDDLALAGLQLVRVRGEDAGDGEDAGVDVGDRVAGLHRRRRRARR